MKSISELMEIHNKSIAKSAVDYMEKQKSKHGPKASPKYKSVTITHPEHKNLTDYWK